MKILPEISAGDELHEERGVPSWSFLTNHALVLLYISQRPESTGLEIAQAVGITERATRRIVDDLEVAGYIEREKVGRRNRYRVDPVRPLARIGERELTLGQLLELVLRPQRDAGAQTVERGDDHHA
jgi:DNA-binding IclR family transcriptional regulator